MTFADDSHPCFHRLSSLNPCAAANQRAHHGSHLVHHVVREVAVQHPVARILRFKLDVPALRNADKHGVLRRPRRLRHAAPFRSRDVKSVPM